MTTTTTARDLACWCPLDLPCHADTLLAIANNNPSADVRRFGVAREVDPVLFGTVEV